MRRQIRSTRCLARNSRNCYIKVYTSLLTRVREKRKKNMESKILHKYVDQKDVESVQIEFDPKLKGIFVKVYWNNLCGISYREGLSYATESAFKKGKNYREMLALAVNDLNDEIVETVSNLVV